MPCRFSGVWIEKLQIEKRENDGIWRALVREIEREGYFLLFYD
jgi:hypothetical protein